MAWFSSLFKVGAKSVGKTAVKDLDNAVIKTTSKTGKISKLLSGGRNVVKEEASGFSKGVTGLGKISGKIVKVGAPVAIVGATGLYGYDKLKQVLARTPEFYNTKDMNNQYADETDNLNDRIKLLEDAKNNGIGGDTNNYLEGGSTTPSETSTEGLTDNQKIMIGAGVLLILGLGTYGYTHRKGAK